MSVVGLGCWQLGADWGEVSEDDALATLHAAADAGVTFFDTADVYGDGRSERLVGRLLRERPDDGLFVATKMGRRADPHVPAAFTGENLRAWNDRSRRNLGVDTLDLVQLHCPPTSVLSDDRVFDELDAMVDEGRLRAYGVSVETVDEALTAIARPHVASIQIILNVFRRKPLERVLPAAVDGRGRHRRPGAAGQRAAQRAVRRDTRRSRRTTTAPTTGRARRSTSARPSPGVPFEVGVAAAREVAALTPSGRDARPSSRCAGCSTSPG